MTTTTWTGTAGDGLWATAGNWDNGVPDVTKDTVIAGASPIKITLAAAAADGNGVWFAHTLSLDLSNYTGVITLADELTQFFLAIHNGLSMHAGSSIVQEYIGNGVGRAVVILAGTVDCHGARIDSLYFGTPSPTAGPSKVIDIVSNIACGYGVGSDTRNAMQLQIGGFGGNVTIHLHGSVITYTGNTTADNSEVAIDRGLVALDWTAGAKIVIITSNGDGTDGINNSTQIFDDGQSFPFPPIEVQGDGRVLNYTDMPFTSLLIAPTVVRWAIAQPDWPATPPAFNLNVLGDLTAGCPITGMNENGDAPVGLDGLAIAVGGNLVATGSAWTGDAAPWTLAVTGTGTFTGTTISYCDASGSAAPIHDFGGTDGGHNTNILFGPAPSSGPSGCLMAF